MTDLSNNKMYAVKVIPQSRVSKPHQRDKVHSRARLDLCVSCREFQYLDIVGFFWIEMLTQINGQIISNR